MRDELFNFGMMVASFAASDRAVDRGNRPDCEGLMAVALGKMISHGLALATCVKQCLSSSLQYLWDAALSPFAIATGGFECRGEFTDLFVKMLFILHVHTSKPNSTCHSHLARLPSILFWNVAVFSCPFAGPG